MFKLRVDPGKSSRMDPGEGQGMLSPAATQPLTPYILRRISLALVSHMSPSSLQTTLCPTAAVVIAHVFSTLPGAAGARHVVSRLLLCYLVKSFMKQDEHNKCDPSSRGLLSHTPRPMAQP